VGEFARTEAVADAAGFKHCVLETDRSADRSGALAGGRMAVLVAAPDRSIFLKTTKLANKSHCL